MTVFNSARGELGFSYTNGDVIGSGTIGGLTGPPSDPLPPGVGSMLHEAGSRASRDTNTFMISSGLFTGAFASTYALPALLAAAIAGGEAGSLYFGPFTREVARFAQKYNINGSSEASREVLFNLDMNVDKFISTFRQGSIRGVFPSQFLQMSVREAIASGDSTVRKLLTNGRFAK